MRIAIKKMQVEMPLGVHAWEKQGKQVVYVSVAMEYDTREAAESDRIDNAIDYDAVAQAVRDILNEKHYELIETAAQTLLDRLLWTLRVDYLRIELEKPNAIPTAQGVMAIAESRR